MSATIEIKCPKHPKYAAKGVPRADCRPCWEMYFTIHGGQGHSFDVKRITLPDDCPNCGGSAPA